MHCIENICKYLHEIHLYLMCEIVLEGSQFRWILEFVKSRMFKTSMGGRVKYLMQKLEIEEMFKERML